MFIYLHNCYRLHFTYIITKHWLHSPYCTIQLVAYFAPCTFYYPTFILPFPHFLNSKHWFVLFICESVSFLLYSLVCCIFQISHVSYIMHCLCLTFHSVCCVCCVCVQLLSPDTSKNLWTIACQAPLSMGFPRQAHWSGLQFPPPGDLANQTYIFCTVRQ